MENIQFERNCPICGGTVGKTLFHFSVNMPDIKHFPAKYNVVACENCGMAFADAALTKELLESYYENQNNYENVDHVKAGLYDESCAIYYKTIHSFCSKEESILDIGCGCGALLGKAKSLYPRSEVYGIEIVPKVAEIASRMGEVLCGDIEKAELPWDEGYFDYITLGDVLEHLMNPEDVLKKLRRYLKDGGHIIVSMPNLKHFSGGWISTPAPSPISSSTPSHVSCLTAILKNTLTGCAPTIKMSATASLQPSETAPSPTASTSTWKMPGFISLCRLTQKKAMRNCCRLHADITSTSPCCHNII